MAMFGVKKRRRALDPEAKRRAMTPEAALMGIPESQRAPKLGLMDKLGAVGGLMTDFSGNTSGAFAMHVGMNRDKLARMVRQQEEEKRAKMVAQLVGGQGGAGGMTPQMEAAAALNPQAVAKAIAEQQFGHHTVNAGDSLVTYGAGGPQMQMAQKSFQHDNRVGTLGPDGFQTFDLGASHKDANTRLGHEVDAMGHRVTDRGNALDYGLGMAEDATARMGHDVTRYGHDVRATGDRLSYDADMAQLAHDRTVAERNAASGPKRALSGVPMIGPDGQFAMGQLTADGQMLPAAMPEGFTAMDPFGRKFAETSGSAMGKATADANVGLPAMARRLDAFGDKADLLNATIDRAVEQSNGWNTGPIMGRNPLATDLDATLRTIGGNIGFDALQEMRDNSPTGGALGQVSDREIQTLQALQGDIGRAQSQEQLDGALRRMKQYYAGVGDRLRQAYEADVARGLVNPAAASPFAQPSPASGSSPAAAGGGWSDVGGGVRIRAKR